MVLQNKGAVMKSVRMGSWFALCISMLAALPAAAADKAVNLALITPVSLAKADDAVTAFRFNLIYGKNTSVKMVDLGLINHTTSGLSKGLEWGFLNFSEGEVSGIQLGGININKGTAKGFQWAGINYAANAGGLQLALVNYAEKIQGIQIGAINIIKEGGFLPVMIIANWNKK
jgi:hypothetical protein